MLLYKLNWLRRDLSPKFERYEQSSTKVDESFNSISGIILLYQERKIYSLSSSPP